MPSSIRAAFQEKCPGSKPGHLLVLEPVNFHSEAQQSNNQHDSSINPLKHLFQSLGLVTW